MKRAGSPGATWLVKVNCPVMGSNVFVAIDVQADLAAVGSGDVNTEYLPPGCPVPLRTMALLANVHPVNVHVGAATEFVVNVTVPNFVG